MNIRIVNMLEAIKHNRYTASDEYLSAEDTAAICSWYSQYTTSKEYGIEDVIDLMYYLYVRENIDLYPRDVFVGTVDYLVQRHSLKESCICDLLSSYHKLVFNA